VGNPRQARDFAKATGQWATTDVLDARALAHFAEAVRPTPRPLPDAQAEALRALLTRRRQLVAMRTAEQNRLGSAPPWLQPASQAHITWLETRLAALDDDLETTLRLPTAAWGGGGSTARHHARACPHPVRHRDGGARCRDLPHGLLSAPCAHTFSWLWVAHLYTCRTLRSGNGGARCPSYLSTVFADALLSHRFASMT
jgi:hypothetical protein